VSTNLEKSIPVWLVPKFTEIEEHACTSFKRGTVPSFVHIFGRDDVAPLPRTEGVFLACKDGGGDALRIRHVQILRTSTPVAAPTMKPQLGRTGVLERINQYSLPSTSAAPNTFLHLIWKY